MTTDPAEIVRALWQRIWIDCALDELGALVTDPYVRHTREGTLVQRPSEYAATISSAVATIRGTEVIIDEMTTVGDTVWARITLHAVNLTTTDPVRITWMGQYRIENGRVTESWVLHEAGLDWSRD